MNERIALGLGDNIDYEIVWNSDVLEDLIRRYDICACELSVDRVIDSERELVISILAFLQAGTGGERIVSSSAIVEQFARYFDYKITLGGTSVRAAVAMRKLGFGSALHLSTTNEDVRRLIPPDSPYVCSNPQDALYPHLIVQFGPGHRVCVGELDIGGSRANRIIYHHDDANIAMNINEGFADLVTEAQVFLISGFNAMQSEDLLGDRLDALQRIMQSLPPGSLVFYEEAGFHNPRFSRLIHARLAGAISVLSLNEDELQDFVARQLDLLDAVQVRAALQDLHALIPVPILVVHTMHWAAAYGPGLAQGGGPACYTRALKGGVTMATTRFCHGDDFTAEDYRRTESLPPNPAGAAFCRDLGQLLGDRVRCVPVAQVDQAHGVTVGLGDAFVGGFLPALLPSP